MVSDILIPRLYADDSNMLVQRKDLSNMINQMNMEMRKVAQRVNANQLSINLNKTYKMIFKTKKRKLFNFWELFLTFI